MMRSVAIVPRACLFVLCSGALLHGQEPPLHVGQERSESSDRAVVALQVELEVEQTLQQEDLQSYERLGRSRSRSLSRLQELYTALDAAVTAADPASRERVAVLLEQIEAAEAERRGLLIAQRTLVDRLAQRGRRTDLLRQEIAALDGRRESTTGVLSGKWDVVLLPLEQRGSFTLRQSGTLVSGTYQLAGGWSGSLQGTLVNRKVYLVRIDSKLGRSTEFEGFLAGDGKTIRGSWLNYELAGADGGSGQWSATKR